VWHWAVSPVLTIVIVILVGYLVTRKDVENEQG
jgi:hypothetical protein